MQFELIAKRFISVNNYLNVSRYGKRSLKPEVRVYRDSILSQIKTNYSDLIISNTNLLSSEYLSLTLKLYLHKRLKIRDSSNIFKILEDSIVIGIKEFIPSFDDKLFYKVTLEKKQLIVPQDIPNDLVNERAIVKIAPYHP